MRSTADTQSEKSGFTLIELMVVLVLIGILSAMIIPEMRGTYENALLRSSSRQWMDAISLAYSRAVTVNQAHRIRLDRRRDEYFIERRVSGPGGREEFIPVADDTGSGKIDPRITVELRPAPQQVADDGQQSAPPMEPEKMEGREDVISFYPDGTADACEIILRDRDGFRLALRVNPVTARVQLLELERQ